MDTILVTGASGNVGAEVMRSLLAQGQSVRAAYHHIPQAGKLPAGVEAVALDFTRPEGFPTALQGVKRLFLMRPPALSDTRRYLNPFIDAASAAGVEQIVFLSLLGAEHNQVVPHAQVEAYLREVGLPWTFLRASFFMQNLSSTHRADIREYGELLVPAGNGKTSFIDVRDIAAVAVQALTQAGHTYQAYPLTGASALSYAHVAETMSTVLGRPIVYRRPSIARFVVAMRRRGIDWPAILVMVAIYTTARLGLAATVTPHTAELLNRPPIAFQQFVEDYRTCWN